MVYPPWINACPDYWKQTVDDDGNRICQRDNTQNMTGYINCDGHYTDGKYYLEGKTSDDFTTMAQACNVPWEGINDP